MASQVYTAHCIGGRQANQGVPHPVNLNVLSTCDQDHAHFHERPIKNAQIPTAAVVNTNDSRKVGRSK